MTAVKGQTDHVQTAKIVAGVGVVTIMGGKLVATYGFAMAVTIASYGLAGMMVGFGSGLYYGVSSMNAAAGQKRLFTNL